ncbi:17.4 kDa class III heat shock protein [Impatiens glandulifera]|uniref:17.4 kDa class III heat shock protein n=1 Tax=Impatiens glandulifera TaxID=253017 RepID=UPI001FB0B3EE|nr:17.4 kDa class III heat shock protein [Impatiens glandulifera]
MDSGLFNLAGAANHLLNLSPQGIANLVFPIRAHETINEINGPSNYLPVDILDSQNEYIFFIDVPGLSKTDIQVTVEEENTLVIRSSGKRKRDDEEGCCKYIRMERRAQKKMMRKFRLPENAKCENGVLNVVVEKLPPPPKTVKVVDIS